ncbi:MAG TPA: methyltransferase domain-containing protein [Frankiaceae bacterium]|jgi:SAM-dependent methyltransferase|nr:methyltransferase domain-containing protein [Frankiaceae bacterium]
MADPEDVLLPVGASAALYDRLADDYDGHFAVAHRAAYDQLAWELTLDALPPAGATVVDVGCGSGRWAERLVALGYRVIGIEPAPRMAAAARRRLGADITIFEQPVESVELPARSVDAVLAMGSLQYSRDVPESLARMTNWVRPGGCVVVLVDSLVALVAELSARGDHEQALQRLGTRRGTWTQDGQSADLHLLDAQGVRAAYASAGSRAVDVRGLLVGWTMLGRDGFLELLAADPAGRLAIEREWAQHGELADLGKQLLAVGRC